MADAREAAGRRTTVLVRSIEFPSKPGSKVAEEIAKVITGGGRRAVIEDADCLTMLALREFRAKHASAPNLATWLAHENPLSQLPVLRAILGLDRFEPAGRAAVVCAGVRSAVIGFGLPAFDRRRFTARQRT